MLAPHVGVLKIDSLRRCAPPAVSPLQGTADPETYVSSIYKCYIGCRPILESRAATKEAVDKAKVGK